jgi:hypothetical protein
MTMLFEKDNGADQGRHQNLLQQKYALQKINVLFWWDIEGIIASS